MADTKFTPGPWFVGDERSEYGRLQVCAPDIDDSPWIVAEVVLGAGYKVEPEHANAALIAAASEMYQAIVDLTEIVDSTHPSAPAYLDEARAVLTKARGGK